MSSISSTTSSFYNSYGIKNTGIGGLASGMNTEEIVDAMTYSTRLKIAQQQQKQQLLLWQQTAYRSVASTLSAFQTKHFTFSGSVGGESNIGSNAFFNTYKGTSSSDKVTLNTSNTSAVGTLQIDRIYSLATAEKITSKVNYNKNAISGEFTLPDSFYGKTLSITLDNGVTRNIRLDSLDEVVASTNSSDPSKLAKALQNELQSLVDDAVGTRSVVDEATGELETDGDGNVLRKSIVTVELGYSSLSSEGASYSIGLKSDSNKVTVSSACDTLGLESGETNRLDLTRSIADVFGDTFGDEFTFSINGTEITMKSSESVNTLMTRINTSGAGVNLSFSSVTQEFTFTAKQTGAGNNIDIVDISGDFMRNFIGANASSSLTSKDFTIESDLTELDLGYAASFEGSVNCDADTIVKGLKAGGIVSFDLTIDGQKKTITLQGDPNTSNYDNNAKWLEAAINSQIETQFGSDSGVTFEMAEFGSDGEYRAKFNITGEQLVVVDDSKKFLGIDGVKDNDNGATASTELSKIFGEGKSGSFTITAFDNSEKTINWESGDDLRSFIDQINTAYGAPDGFELASVSNNRITFNADEKVLKFEDVGENGAMQTLFGKSTYDSTPLDSSELVYYRERTAGTNAEILVNGQIQTSATNSFTIDGISFEVNQTHDVANDPITLTSSSDPDELIDKITEFVEEYNVLVETLNKLVNEDKSSGYEPLTDEQKAEMTDDQIEKWETEAKKGLLRSDSTIRNILTQMRQVMYQKVEAAGLSLYDIGISGASYISNASSSGYNYDKAGTLTIDEDKLRSAIENNPDGVRILFTHKDSGDDVEKMGIAYAMSTIIDRATSTSSDPEQRGSLIRKAGTTTSTADNTSEIGNKLDNIERYLERLQDRLESEYARYWDKFTALETAIQQMNAQSSWLADFGA